MMDKLQNISEKMKMEIQKNGSGEVWIATDAGIAVYDRKK